MLTKPLIPLAFPCVFGWCQGRELNPRPRAYESPALPLSYPGTATDRSDDPPTNPESLRGCSTSELPWQPFTVSTNRSVGGRGVLRHPVGGRQANPPQPQDRRGEPAVPHPFGDARSPPDLSDSQGCRIASPDDTAGSRINAATASSVTRNATSSPWLTQTRTAKSRWGATQTLA